MTEFFDASLEPSLALTQLSQLGEGLPLQLKDLIVSYASDEDFKLLGGFRHYGHAAALLLAFQAIERFPLLPLICSAQSTLRPESCC